MMRRRDLIKAAAGAAACAALAAPAIAQGVWPASGKPVKVIVPWPPGAANDALGRLVAQSIRDKFGVTVVVENQTGGSGLIGTKAVIAAAPDGYTLLASAFNTAVMPLVLKAAECGADRGSTGRRLRSGNRSGRCRPHRRCAACLCDDGAASGENAR